MHPHCACFNLCNARSAAYFHLRLPIIHSRDDASPWYDYLRFVYSSDVPLPFEEVLQGLLYV